MAESQTPDKESKMASTSTSTKRAPAKVAATKRAPAKKAASTATATSKPAAEKRQYSALGRGGKINVPASRR